MPDPRIAVENYARAVRQGDSAAVYAMLTRSAQRDLGRVGVDRLMAESKDELREDAAALASSASSVRAEAIIRYDDGESVTLELSNGDYRVGTAAALPTGARTPSEALAELRRVLARRSYAGLMRVMTPDASGALERQLRSLVEGLERPEALHTDTQEDSAVVTIPGGHTVRLRRIGGVWQVHDFE